MARISRVSPKWTEIEAFYVQGESRPEGEHFWPTMEQVAERFGERHDRVRKHAGPGGWTTKRAHYADRLAREKREARTSAIIKESAEFDSSSLKLAKALQGNVAALIGDITRMRQVRDAKLRAVADDPAALAALLNDPRYKPATGHQLTALATALATAQRVGRLALGDPTETVDAQHRHSGGVAHQVTGALAVSHTLTADPQAVVAVARILREAGIEQ